MLDNINSLPLQLTATNMTNMTDDGNNTVSLRYADMWTLDYTSFAIFISVFSLIGLVGNVPVLIVYLHRKEQTASNTFIMTLAILDLTVCAFIMPYTLVYELHLVYSDVVCRTFEFLRHFLIFASNLTLVAIASERYIAVCKITHKLSVTNVRHGITFIFLLSCFVAGPSIGIFAVVSSNDVEDVKCKFKHELTVGKFCHFTFTIIGETYAIIYQGILMTLFFVSLIVIVVFYVIIYSELWKRTKFRRRALSGRPKEAQEISEAQSSLCEQPLTLKTDKNVSDVVRTYEFENDESDVVIKESQVVSNNINTKTKKTKTEKIRRVYHRRTAKMLFLCTVIYLITWLPFWGDIFGISDSLLLRYLFFIGNATNPIVYGIVNTQIRKEFKILWSRFCSWRIFRSSNTNTDISVAL